MIARTLSSMLVSISSVLLMTGTVQAQGLFGVPFFTPYNSRPQYVSPCGPGGCPTAAGYSSVQRSSCPGGVCTVPSYSYSSNYAPRSYGLSSGSCGPNGCSTAPCVGGNCPTSCPNGQCLPGNGVIRTMPNNYGYPTRSLPMPAAPVREYNTNRPIYYYDDVPVRSAPPSYLDPRVNPYYGASRNYRNDAAAVETRKTTFGTDRSPFYP